jgi:hypothetical protein
MPMTTRGRGERGSVPEEDAFKAVRSFRSKRPGLNPNFTLKNENVPA